MEAIHMDIGDEPSFIFKILKSRAIGINLWLPISAWNFVLLRYRIHCDMFAETGIDPNPVDTLVN